jgi:hypothetical protein
LISNFRSLVHVFCPMRLSCRMRLVASWLGSVFFSGKPVIAWGPPDADLPLPFGYKTGWLALKTSDLAAVIRQLDLTQVRQATWQQGLAETRAYPPAGTPVFICPPYRDGRWLSWASIWTVTAPPSAPCCVRCQRSLTIRSILHPSAWSMRASGKRRGRGGWNARSALQVAP